MALATGFNSSAHFICRKDLKKTCPIFFSVSTYRNIFFKKNSTFKTPPRLGRNGLRRQGLGRVCPVSLLPNILRIALKKAKRSSLIHKASQSGNREKTLINDLFSSELNLLRQPAMQDDVVCGINRHIRFLCLKA